MAAGQLPVAPEVAGPIKIANGRRAGPPQQPVGAPGRHSETVSAAGR